MPQGWQRLAAGPKIALIAAAVAAGGALAQIPQARAADPLDAFDDPKLARELPSTPPPATRAPVPPVAVPSKPVASPAVSRPPAPKATIAVTAKPPAPPVVSPSVAPKAAVAAAPAKPLAPVATSADRAVVGGQPPPSLPVGPAKPASAPSLPGRPSLAPAVVLSPAPFVAPTSPATVAAAAPAPITVVAPAIAPLPSAAVTAPAPIKPAAPLAATPAAPASEAKTHAGEPAARPTATADLTAKARSPEPAAAVATGPWPYRPRLKLAYRFFSFSRMPASGSTGAAASETFQSLSLDAYPTSTYLRVGFSSQFGWESGGFQRTGDYFLAESVSTGFQLPGRFTPFLEGLAGAGYMRRLQGGSSSPTAYWQLGVDAGVEVYFASRAYVSVALGFLRPGNLFVQQKNLSGIDADTWSLKFGVGI